MPSFTYTAKDTTGRLRNGVMQAESEAAVLRTLDQQDLYPVRITPEEETARNILGGLRRSRKIRTRDLGTAYGQLSDLLVAGVPMLKALDILARTSAHPAVAKVFKEIEQEVAGGSTLADAMAKHPEAFGGLHVAMVRAGETAGFLEDVLLNLAGFLARQDELRAKVTGAMIYPVILACFATLAVLVMLIWLVPQFAEFLGDTPLPLPSVVLFAVSAALRANWPLLLAGGAVVAAAGAGCLRSEAGRQFRERWKLRLPVAGKAVRMVAITRFCRVLGTMLANGINILEALAISKDATGNALMSAAIEEASENVRAGEPLAEPLRRSEFFPTEIVEMIAIAEESNQLEKVLLQIADTVERRTNQQVDAAVRLIEPLMLMLMAGVIGFIAMGLLYPIFSMAQNVT